MLNAIDIAGSIFGVNSEEVVSLLRTLANEYASLERRLDASRTWQRILEIEERLHGRSSLEVASSLDALATVERGRGRFDESRNAAQRGLDIRLSLLESPHLAVAESLNTLGETQFATGELKPALELFQQSLSISERLLGTEDPRVGEALNNVAVVYLQMARYAEAIPLLQRSLGIYERTQGAESRNAAWVCKDLAHAHLQVGQHGLALALAQRSVTSLERVWGPDHTDVAAALDTLAGVYKEVARHAAALPLYTRALAIRERLLENDDFEIGASLANLAGLYRRMGRFSEALTLYERALVIFERRLGPDHETVATGLNNLGLLLFEMGQYGKALPKYQRALSIRERALGADHPRVATSLNNLGLLYDVMGRYDQALALVERSLSIRRAKLGLNHPLTAQSETFLAGLYKATGRMQEAVLMYERALAAFESTFGPDHPEVARSLNNLAVLRADQGEVAKARQGLERALAIRDASLGTEHPEAARTSTALADLYLSGDETDKAFALLQRAERAAAVSASPAVLWQAQYLLSKAYGLAHNDAAAIFWGKQAVNTIQTLRAGMTSLDRELQQSYLADKRGVYAKLAGLLIDAGRLSEAQQVLTMLKEQELHEFLSREADDDPRQARATYVGPTERAAEARRRELSGRLAEFGRERNELQRESKLGLSEEQRARLSQLEQSMQQANQSYDEFIAGLTKEFALASTERIKEFGSRQLDNLVTVQDALRELGDDTVLLHYVVTDKRVAIIVTTPEVQVARESAVTPADLNRRVQALRASLRDRGKVLAHAQALYKWLIEPVAADLQQAKAKKLALSLDGTLRYVPFAVLHDGKRYLVERYALSVYTEAARANLRRNPSAQWTMTGLGLTRAVPGFRALPAVRAELEGIRGRIIPGEVYLDDEFTAQRLAYALSASVPVLHIASHFSFRPGTDAESFLVLGDGSRMTLQEMRERRLRFGAVELLTLSACDTAMGGGRNENGAEVEGFGALAQRQGAQAVLATLWPVVDESTGVFMREMYSRRLERTGIGKAEALRHAQLAFLHHTGLASSLPEHTSHPFFWAPFILMGNWL